MVEAILGTRIREKRRQRSVTQADLARQIGISPSYLNLIERNKRRITAPVLHRIAAALDAELEDLDGAAERRLVETLTEIAHLPALDGLDVIPGSAPEFIARYPGWARALAAMARAERSANQTARALSDRLTHDPFLGETVHRMLTRISAIRAAAEILTDYDDISEDQRQRFHAIVRGESEALTDNGEALASYFEGADDTEQAMTPLDEVESLFVAHDNRFGGIEDAVERNGAETPEVAACIAALIDVAPQIETAAARARAMNSLTEYAGLAASMPEAGFAEAARGLRYDAEALADRFGVTPDAVCRRLTALPAGSDHPKFGYLCANASGTITQMLGISGLSVPRYAPACPLWALYRAQQTPERFLCQRAAFPNGTRFVFAARARNTAPQGHARPRHYLTDMLALDERDARQTVYAPEDGAPIEEVGPACRLCPRAACPYRVEDPLAA